jgi:hypothetical protein
VSHYVLGVCMNLCPYLKHFLTDLDETWHTELYVLPLSNPKLHKNFCSDKLVKLDPYFLSFSPDFDKIYYRLSLESRQNPNDRHAFYLRNVGLLVTT